MNIKLYVKTVELMDGLSLDLARRLDTKPARYSMRKSMLKSLFISEGRYQFNANIFTDEVPRRVIIGFIENEAFHGHKNKSPFNFKNFDVRDIAIVANGRDYPQTVKLVIWFKINSFFSHTTWTMLIRITLEPTMSSKRI